MRMRYHKNQVIPKRSRLLSILEPVQVTVPESDLAISEPGSDIFHSWSRIHTNIILLAGSKCLLFFWTSFSSRVLELDTIFINMRGESMNLQGGSKHL